MEDAMSTMPIERNDVSTSERRLLEVLHEKGPQTLDNLCALPDMSWAQVLMAVDHLSRSGEVVIELIAPCEYQVALNGRKRDARF
jgi:hypothetical protein